jgi:hypothetical protein
LSGFSALKYTSTVGGSPPPRPSVPCSRSITSGGITSAPSASPDSTLAIAASRLSTRIGSTASKSSDA